MTEAGDSVVQLEPSALNTLLDQFVNRHGDVTCRYEAGELRVLAQGLAITVHQVTLDETGLTVHSSTSR